MDFKDDLTTLKGIGPKKASLFKKLGIENIGSLLYHFPRTYREYPEVSERVVDSEEPVSITGSLLKSPVVRRTPRITITTAYIMLGEVRVSLVWFNIPHISKSLCTQKRYVFHGILKKDGSFGYKMEQPQIFTPEKYLAVKDSLQPIYPLTKDLNNSTIVSAMSLCLKGLDDLELWDFIPKDYREKENLTGISQAFNSMHFPLSKEDFLLARRRMVFNEFFDFFLRVNEQKSQTESIPNTFNINMSEKMDKAIDSLPFKLTKGQLDTARTIQKDLSGSRVTQRLIQADVGSGKTVISFLAMLLCAENGYKSAIMAPTEVLATQHFATFKKFCESLCPEFDVVLLTGKMSAAEKKEAKKKLQSPGPLFVIGTHALIQKGVKISDLALVVVDEQHRFGVKQRKQLSDKGDDPFYIVMSATPIPRSLALILYGDMNVSIIKDVPSIRLPIKNCIMKNDGRKKAYQFIMSQVLKGHQAYIICPLVDKSEKTEAENVVEYTDNLRKLLPDSVKIGMLHGKMSSDEKNEIMEGFSSHKTQILVSTTVIEVGIDVPNATVIMIENAKRFGLAQLHQLRGRVGRGAHQSYCIFMDETEDGEDERLKVINSSNDGFFVANEDLKLRGPGELFGLRQSGGFGFILADIYRDTDIMEKANEYAQKAILDEKLMEALKDGLYQALPSWSNWYNI